jgi:hypothetical protein
MGFYSLGRLKRYATVFGSSCLLAFLYDEFRYDEFRRGSGFCFPEG